MSELDDKLAKARRIKNPERRARAEARVLEEMAVESGQGDPMTSRKKRPAGGGQIKRGS